MTATIHHGLHAYSNFEMKSDSTAATDGAAAPPLTPFMLC